MRIRYEFTCPVCGRDVVKSCTASARPPVYCGDACFRHRAHAAIPLDRATVWRKYHFDASMQAAIRLATRQRLGALTALWREDPRFMAAGIPYAILKREAVLLGCVRTEPNTVWQPDEQAYALQRLAHGSPPDAISRSMRQRGWHRSPGALVALAQREGEARNAGYVSLHQIALGLGLESHVPHRWVRQGLLRVHHTSDQESTQFVSYPELRRFVAAHPVQAGKGVPDFVWLIGVLTAPGAGDTRDAATPLAEDGSWLTGAALVDRAAAD